MSIDLYAIYNLDKQKPPEALAQQLDQRLAATDPSDTLARGRIETAKAVLGDPSRRAVYDQQLTDPSAPPVTEATLAALSGRPAPTVPHTLGSALATMQGKLIAGAAAALVLILLVVIAVVAVSGGDDDGGTAVTASSSPGASDGSASQEEVSPNLFHAKVGGTVHKRTGRDAVPPQRIRITENVDFAQTAESIGYGELEQARCGVLPTEQGSTAFRVTPYNKLIATWDCDNIHYGIVFDTSGDRPVVTEAAQSTRQRDGSYVDPVLERIWSGAHPEFNRKASVFDVTRAGMLVDSPDQLPVSAVSVAQSIGVKQATVISAIQVDEDEGLVYFLVPDSLSVWVGELEANPDK